MSRIKNKKTTVKEGFAMSKQLGNKQKKEVSMDLRILFDTQVVLQKEYKLEQYTLNYVSKYFLKDEKDDMHHSDISIYHRGQEEIKENGVVIKAAKKANEHTRSRVCKYW
jgi:DNA polymerase delta subunit 1